MPDNIIKLSNRYLNNPERVSIGQTNVVAVKIKQEVIHVDQSKKYATLVGELTARDGSVIVFAKTKHGSDRIAKNLRRDGFTAEALHGDLRQNKRDKVMKNFRNDNFRILVATDIAARGLDVPHIAHVINHDLPQVPEDYIHRMGRTARAGAEGSALCLISPQEGRLWHAIEVLLDPSLKKHPGASGPGRKKPGTRRNRGGSAGGGRGRGKRSEEGRGRGEKSERAPSGHRGKRSEGQKSGEKGGEGSAASGSRRKRSEGYKGGETSGRSSDSRQKRSDSSKGGKPSFSGNRKSRSEGFKGGEKSAYKGKKRGGNTLDGNKPVTRKAKS